MAAAADTPNRPVENALLRISLNLGSERLALGCRPMSVVTSETSGELAVVLIQMKHRTLPTSDLSASVRALGDGRG